jgi:Xaa-Pro aminopeptidase
VTSRLAQARERMAAVGVDLLAVSPSDDLSYLVGFSPTADERTCMLLVGAEDAAFVVPSLNAVQSRAALPDVPFVEWADADGPTGALRAGLEPFDGARRVAVDGTMRADALLLLQSLLPQARVEPATAVVGELRLRKDEEELAALGRSAAAADAAMTAALAACRAGATEADVAEAASAGFRAAGCEEVMFTSVASGPNGAFPHHHTAGRVLAEGDGVTIDIGGRLGGYPSDITRMAHVGEPSERVRTVVETVERALQAALAAVRPGATCAAIDQAARSMIAAAGYGDFFVHRTGHGLGVSGHEPPWIMAGDERRIEPGMVFSIEPGIYLPGELGVRLEEIVAVTAGGCKILSGLDRELAVVA